MRVKRYVLVSAAALAVGAGAGGAVAASGGDDGKKAEQSILADAAQRLNVSPDALRSALSAAEDAQIDQAVKDGKLTQQQADAIKARRKQDGRVLGGAGGRGHGGPGGVGGPGQLGARGAVLDAAATALGLAPDALRTQLSSGKSIADLAKADNKNLDDVKAAIKAAVTKQLDADVTAGRLTSAQRTDALAELDQHLDVLVTSTFDRFARGAHAAGPRHRWR
jgi:hypothetical protein